MGKHYPDHDPPNFINDYIHAAGDSKVPDEFHVWLALQVIAAAVANRVWYEKFAGKRLYPNIYVMLIGPSGTGKGTAIGRSESFLPLLDEFSLDQIQHFRGKATPQALITRMSQPRKEGEREIPPHSWVWFVNPELAMAVGSGSKADDFIKHMTELYEGDYEFIDATRMYGVFTVKDPCVNWTSASTREWLVGSIGKQDILSGFFARVCAIPCPRKPNWRDYPDPIPPPDYEEVQAHLVRFVQWLACQGGRMTFEPEAQALRKRWYVERPDPTEELLWPFFERQDDHVIKLSMLLALAGGRHIMTAQDVTEAIALTEMIYSRLPKLLEYAHRTPETEMLSWLSEQVRQAPAWLDHSTLLRKSSNRGANKFRFNDLITTLVERGDIVIRTRKGGAKFYCWRGKEDTPLP